MVDKTRISIKKNGGRESKVRLDMVKEQSKRFRGIRCFGTQ